MNMTDEGIELLKKLEGCKLEAYPDPVSGGDPWTISYGVTEGVTKGMRITQDQAEELFRAAREKKSAQVRAAVHPSLTDNQFSAAVIFAYNMRNWAATPLFRLLKEGDFAEAEEHWLRYDKGTNEKGEKIEVPGLLARREAELNLFRKA